MSFPICQKANDASCLFLVETGHHPVQLPVLSGLRALRVLPTCFACADTGGWFSHTLLDHAWIRRSSDQVNKVQPLTRRLRDMTLLVLRSCVLLVMVALI